MRFFTPVESSSLLLSKEVHQIWQTPWPWLRFNLFLSKLWITKSQNNMKQFNLTRSTSIQSDYPKKKKNLNPIPLILRHLAEPAGPIPILFKYFFSSSVPFNTTFFFWWPRTTRLSAPSLPLYLYGLVPCYNSSKRKKRIAYQHNTPPNTNKNQCHFLTLSSSSSSDLLLLPFCFSLCTNDKAQGYFFFFFFNH